MCHASAPQQMPLTAAPPISTPGPSGPPANTSSGDLGSATPAFNPLDSDPLTVALRKEQAANPTMVSVDAPTRFGQLMKIVTPMLEGAAIGGFSGKGHPGGGFGAAQDFYDKKRDRDLRMAQFQRQAAQTQAQIDERSRANDISQERADREDWGQPIAGQDAAGNPIFVVRNRRTGETKQVQGVSPLDKDNGSVQHVMTDQGLVLLDRSGKARLATLDDNSQVATGAPMGPPRSTGVVQFGGRTYPMNVAQVPGAPPQSPGALRTGRAVGSLQGNGAPLMPPSRPQHEDDFSQFYDKWLDDNSQDDTAANRLKARALYSGAQRKPSDDDTGGLKGKAYTKRQGQYLDQLNRGFAASEAQRTKELNSLGKDVMAQSSPDDLAAKQQAIEEENADRKQALHQRIVDAAAGQGIDLGQVPDYRAQLDGGGQANNGQTTGAPRSAPGGSAQGDKIATPQDVLAWAQKNNISSIEARKQFKAKGYRLVPIQRTQ